MWYRQQADEREVLVLKLLGLPVTLPAAGIKFCLQQVVNAAEAGMTYPAPVKEELLNL